MSSNKTKITKNQIKHLAKLSNLTVDDSKVEMYSTQIEEIVGFVEQLDEIDTKGIKPTYQVNDNSVNVFREDKVIPSLSQKEAISQSSSTHKGYFMVKGVLNEQ